MDKFIKDFKLRDDHLPPPPMDVGHIRRKWLDVAYADQSSAQKLDIYLPDEGKGPFPMIFYIHGGAWQICDKRDVQLTPMLRGVERGYAVVSINYRLSGEAIFPAQIYDVKSALRFIKAEAPQYFLDKHGIAAWGASAGGHLSALLGTSPGIAELEDFSTGNVTEDTQVLAVVDWFGPTDGRAVDGNWQRCS
jgi:acetyl esterase/lipase